MRILKTTVMMCCLGLIFWQPVKAHESKQPLIQIAILLDASNSMDGLIDQTKSQLWKVVNQFMVVKKSGLTPRLEVALYEYGKNTLKSEEDYLRQIVPLSDDLDRISKELFALKTNGGEEYCASVIRSAKNGLLWSNDPADLKIIFVAGNESFAQGSDDYKKMCVQAKEEGIVINTLFCGDENVGRRILWSDGAKRGGGEYLSINQSEKVVYVEAPQDNEIKNLGDLINKTYIPYGLHGQAGCENQKVQDDNAKQHSNKEAYVQRSITKNSRNYTNKSWDLVDAYKNNETKVEDLTEKELPDNMKKMTNNERLAYIKTMAEKRDRLKEKMNKLVVERQKYLEQKNKEQGSSASRSLDTAMIKVICKQAKAKGFN